MEINIKIEGLNQLTEALALIGSALAYKNGMVATSGEAVNLLLDVTDKVEDHTEEEVKKEVIKEVVKEVVQEPVKEEEEETEVIKAEGPPAITIEEIREVFVAKNNIKGNTPKLKEILNEFGAKKVTDLEEKDFEVVLNKLKEI